MEWEGSVRDVLENLESLSKDFSYWDHDSRQKILLAAPRIIRGVLDYKIDNRIDHELVEIINSATNTVVDIYSDPEKIQSAISNFKDFLVGTTHYNGILDTEIHQKIDRVTWESSSFKESEKSANYLEKNLKNTDTLFLLIAHGGIMAGLDVFLRYKSLSGSEKSVVYPVRLSTRKKQDLNPQLDLVEASYLKKVARGKEIIIFDEDCYYGGTMNKFKSFMKEHVFPRKIFTLKTNYKLTTSAELREVIGNI